MNVKQSIGSLNGKSVLSKKPMVLRDWAYEQIKRWILDREILPGTPIVINDLVNEMNISSTPIRDALLRLEAEGLVQIRARTGFFVREISQDDLKQLFELRILIEGFAAEKAARLLNTEDIDALGELFDERAQEKDAEFSKEFLDADQKFHSIIVEGTQNPRLSQIMDSLHDLTNQGQALGLTSFDNLQQSWKEHKEILLALRRRDGQEAGRRMRFHLASVLERLLELLEFPDGRQTVQSDLMDVSGTNPQFEN
jgi:GntR family transcriptional regulator, rspAB operon transcriptional repressor